MPKLREKRAISQLFLLASIGALALLVVAVTSPFGTGFFSRLFVKPVSQASTNTIESLTQQLISENEKLKQATTSSGSSLDSRIGSMATTAYTRKQGLLKLVQSNPKEFLKQATLADKAKDFPPFVQQHLEKRTEKTGKFINIHGDDFKNQKAMHMYYLDAKTAAVGNEKFEIYFAINEPGILTGSEIKVKALEIDKKLVVASGREGAHAIAGTDLDILSTTPINLPAEAKVAVIMINFEDTASSQPYTKDEVLNRILNDQNSTKRFYAEASTNRLGISAEAFGWYTISAPSSECSLLKIKELSLDKARGQGINLDNFNYYSILMPSRTCISFMEVGGMGVVGGTDTWIMDPQSHTYSHELGHNFGLNHASSLRCGTKQIEKPIWCAKFEYGDSYDTMGGRNHLFNSPHDLSFGWLPSSQTQTVTQDGIYNIAPSKTQASSPTSSPVKLLKIAKKDSEDSYYIEYRQPFGYFDSQFQVGPFGAPDAITKGVSIRLWDGNPANNTKLLDMNPLEQEKEIIGEVEALGDNQTFTDPYNGIVIKQLSHDTSGAKIEIKFTQSSVPTVSVSPETTQEGLYVAVEIANINNPHAADWIGIYNYSEQDNQKFLDWFYVETCDKTLGSAVIDSSCAYQIPAFSENKDAPPNYKIYNFRLFSNNTYQHLATSNQINVAPLRPPSPSPSTSISPSPSPTPQPVTVNVARSQEGSQALTIFWSGITSPSNTDWVGLYQSSDPVETGQRIFKDWIYLGSCTKTPSVAKASGTCNFTPPSNLPANKYHLRVFASNSFSLLGTSNEIALGGPTLKVDPTLISTGGTLTMRWSGLQNQKAMDWVGIYGRGSAEDTGQRTFKDWLYIGSCTKQVGSIPSTSGSCSYKIPRLASGAYELRLYSNNGFTRITTSNSFSVQ